MKRYKSLFESGKDPRSEMNFEKKFIGKNIVHASNDLDNYDLEDAGINPVVDSNSKIVGFVYEADNDGKFQGKKISDFGLKQVKNFWIYEM